MNTETDLFLNRQTRVTVEVLIINCQQVFSMGHLLFQAVAENCCWNMYVSLRIVK